MHLLLFFYPNDYCFNIKQINHIICVKFSNLNIDTDNNLKDIINLQIVYGPCATFFFNILYIIIIKLIKYR